ncbi:MAG: class II glutamine amidotransferase [Candidatus Heimdallarchaeaceae archaeon]
MKDLVGLNIYPEIEISLSFKKRDRSKKDKLLGLGVGYYDSEKEWHIVIDKLKEDNDDLSENLEKLKTYRGKTFISGIPIQSSLYLEESAQTLKRKLRGYTWFFALSGEINKYRLVEDIYERRFKFFLRKYIPKGENVNELVFCIILEALSKIRIAFTIKNISAKLKEIAELLEPYGKISFLLSNGEKIFAYRSAPALYYLEIEPPLQKSLTVDTGELELKMINPKNERIVIIASRPIIMNENWKLMERSKVYVFRDGEELELKPKTYWR